MPPASLFPYNFLLFANADESIDIFEKYSPGNWNQWISSDTCTECVINQSFKHCLPCITDAEPQHSGPGTFNNLNYPLPNYVEYHTLQFRARIPLINPYTSPDICDYSHNRQLIVLLIVLLSPFGFLL